MRTAQRSILLASVVAVVFAGMLVVVKWRWAHWLENDAGEYHALAVSITQGAFQLQGQPTMLREPGYPLFRSGFVALHLPVPAILWVQVLLYGLIIWLIGDAVRRVEPRAGPWAAWAAVFAYGLAIYTTSHVTETLSATLASVVLWCLTRALVDRGIPWRWIVATAVALAALLLTRMTFLFLVPLVAAALAWQIRSRLSVRQGLLAGVVVCVLSIGLVFPWSLRNHTRFGEWAVAGKAGSQLYIRAWKSELPTQRLWSTYGSVLLGQSLLRAALPAAQPVILEQWVAYDARSFASEQEGQPSHVFQRQVQTEALQMLRNPRTVVHALLWTGVEELRLFALPSPASPSFSIEGMFFYALRNGQTLSGLQWTMLLGAHVLQFLWWGLLLLSLWWGFRRYGVRFIPGWMIVAVALAYAPADTIVRYGSPAHPWILAAIAWMLVVTSQERIQRGEDDKTQ